MITLYLKIADRELLSTSFRAFCDPKDGGHSGEAFLAYEIAEAINRTVSELVKDGCAPESAKTESMKLIEELNQIGDLPSEKIERKAKMAERIIGELENKDAYCGSLMIRMSKLAHEQSPNPTGEIQP